MPDTIRWGILGTGDIASQFATGLKAIPDAEFAAVGSRTLAKAEAFVNEYGAARCHGSYEALVADPDVDVVYIGTPHPYHKDNGLLCLEHGKPVLCEKPFTLNAADTAKVVAVAREKKLFLMEAMWTRFIPVMYDVRDWLADGAIGEVTLLQADFGFRGTYDEASRLLAPELGGGALLDVGIYPVSFASMVFGAQPTEIASQAKLGSTGVDEHSAYLFKYDAGALAVLYSAVLTDTPWAGVIMGTEGRIQIGRPFWNATEATLIRDGKDPVTSTPDRIGNGYNYEAAAVMDALRQGWLEHPLMPLDESIAIMETMDRIRGQWGLRYPGE